MQNSNLIDSVWIETNQFITNYYIIVSVGSFHSGSIKEDKLYVTMLKFFNVTGVKALRKNSDLVHIDINELERTFTKQEYNKDFLFEKFNYSDI